MISGTLITRYSTATSVNTVEFLKVLAASGRYDLGTPYSASDWSLAQLNAPAEVLARVTHRYYDAGHMMYTRQADLTQLKADVAAWVLARSGAPAGLPRTSGAPDVALALLVLAVLALAAGALRVWRWPAR